MPEYNFVFICLLALRLQSINPCNTSCSKLLLFEGFSVRHTGLTHYFSFLTSANVKKIKMMG